MWQQNQEADIKVLRRSEPEMMSAAYTEAAQYLEQVKRRVH